MITLNLTLARYRFHCRVQSPLRLPAYAGSAWRGLFGITLKHSVCVTRQPRCEGCLLWRNCVYSYIYETPPPTQPQTILKQAPHVPHPYIIRPLATSGQQYQPGDSLSVEIVLIGQANQHLPYLVHTFNRMGEKGLGKPAGHFVLNSVAQYNGGDEQQNSSWQTIYSPQQDLRALPPLKLNSGSALPVGDAVKVEFITPYRGVERGKRVLAEQFTPRQFISTLLRRLSLLQAFHGEGPLDVDFKALVTLAEQVAITEQNLHWHDWTRYSSRQQELIKMGGLLGSVVLRGEVLRILWPVLLAGEQIQGGKGTVMGLGQFRLSAAV
ncbi:MAG: CRISPR system precrRNA processing endoribonuclease RAMP protein Cas6 [Thiolinea sp.]